MFITVAEMVLTKLAAPVAQRVKQYCEGGLIFRDALLRPRHADRQQHSAKRILTKDEGGATSGARILRIGIGEKSALVDNAVDIRRLVAHHAAAKGTDVPKP